MYMYAKLTPDWVTRTCKCTRICIASHTHTHTNTHTHTHTHTFTHTHAHTHAHTHTHITSQGDTLENVAKELDSIIQTGFYIFTLSRDSSSGGLSAQIMLEYKPSTATPHPQAALTTSGGHYQSQPHSSNSSSSEQAPFSFEAEGGATDNAYRQELINFIVDICVGWDRINF